MTTITDNGWTLHYTIFSVLAAKVTTGDLVPLPGGQPDLIVLGGHAPRRANDRGSVIVRDPAVENAEEAAMLPRALGMVWISSSGGWSELPA